MSDFLQLPNNLQAKYMLSFMMSWNTTEKYEFEGRKFYSYNNIEKVLKEWYGPNCLKRWDGKKWVETLPIEKRKPKHTVDLNLKGDGPSEK